MSDKFFTIEEDFEGAYQSRFKEFTYLLEAEDNSKYQVLLMHLGGIVIECYLKFLIITKYKIVKSGKGCGGNSGQGAFRWLSNASIEKIMHKDGGNIKTKTVEEFADVQRPGHNLEDCIKKIPEFNEVFLPDAEILVKLKNVSNPLNTKSGTFVDLRYRDNGYFQDTETFNNWLEDFKSVYLWIDSRKEIIQ